MGEERKKKKGRPSLLDLRKRALKQQQSQHQQQDDLPIANHRLHRSTSRNPNSLNHPPNSASRSKRRNPNRNCVYSWIKYDEDAQDYSDEDYDDRREKKHRLLHGLNSHSHRRSSNSQSSDGGSDLNLDDTPVSRRKITAGSDFTQGEKASKATDILRGSPVESGPTAPLPDKKLLVFILDRLQKKDTYGVYSDPVDPEELPDYHDIITNPMDFSTVRKKLDSGAYASLEQFERDVFLICTNAMEYNSADTVYYRQARAIQELAKKDFENLRRDSDNEPQNQQQQQPEPSSIDRTASEVSADALIPGGDSSNKFSGAYNLRKTPSSSKFRQGESLVRINHNSENQSDWETEFPRKTNSAFFQTYFGQYEPSLSFSVASVVKAVNKYGMKHSNVDDNRRDSYNHLSTFTQEPSVLTTFEDELKELIPVGVNTEYGYAMSLARYAANLGSVAWKTASRRIETVLPSGMKFGLGWVGENPAGPGEDYSRKQNLRMSSRKQKCSNDLASDDNSKRILSPTCSVSSAFIGNRHSSFQGIEETVPPARVLNPETDHPSASSTCQSGPLTNPESSNGLIRGLRGFSHNANQMLGMVRQRQPNLTKEATHGSQQGLLFPYNKQEFHRFPLDLNARIVSPNSPGSNPQAGLSSSQHPDLALQLWR